MDAGMTRDEIVEKINDRIGEDEAADLVLFDGMESAFVGLAERFEPDGHHRYFAVYSYKKMVEILVEDGMDDTDAMEYLEFNTVGLYAGPQTPAILRDE